MWSGFFFTVDVRLLCDILVLIASCFSLIVSMMCCVVKSLWCCDGRCRCHSNTRVNFSHELRYWVCSVIVSHDGVWAAFYFFSLSPFSLSRSERVWRVRAGSRGDTRSGDLASRVRCCRSIAASVLSVWRCRVSPWLFQSCRGTRVTSLAVQTASARCGGIFLYFLFQSRTSLLYESQLNYRKHL